MKHLSASYWRTRALTVFAALLLVTNALAADVSMEAYNAGDIKKAQELLYKELTGALASKSADAKWAAYFRNAWFYVEIDRLKEAIEYFNQALALARELKDPAREGKTLSEMGLAYSHLGLYEAASKIYSRAIEIGAPKNKIIFPMVWGQATQELGALHLAMGNLEKSERTLLQTYRYAESHGVLAGISEGGAYLAALYLLKGNLGKAEDQAQAALQAALTCDCSQYVKSWTQITMARVLIEKWEHDPSITLKHITDVLTDAEKNAIKYHNKRFIAESMMLKSRILPANQKNAKLDLLEKAYGILVQMNSEMRAAAAADLGRAYLMENEKKLAEFYLKNGLDFSRKLFRKIDQSRVIGDLGALSALKGDLKKELDALVVKAKMLETSKAFGPLLETQKAIIEKLKKGRYELLALQWLEKAIKNLGDILEHEEDRAVKESRIEELLALRQLQSETALLVSENQNHE